MKERKTFQRRLVGEKLMNCAHPTAEDVYLEVKNVYPHIGLGTVYRILGTMSHDGSVKRIVSPDGKSRYDINVSAHYHTLCLACGSFADSDVAYDEGLNAAARRVHGDTVVSHDVVFEWICPRCRQRTEDNGGSEMTEGEHE